METITDIPTEPIGGPAAWTGAELQDDPSWIHRLTADQVHELESAAAVAASRVDDLTHATLEDFPLPELSKELADIARELDRGRGFVLIRGLPVDRHTKEELALMYWGMGRHLGIPVAQNGAGDVLGHVRDEGIPEGTMRNGNAARGYNSSRQLTYHTDSSDVVGLLCFHPAKEGGVSTISSSTAIHDELIRTRPDLLEELYGIFGWHNNGEEDDGASPFHTSSVFAWHDGMLSTRYVRGHIEKAHSQFDELPALTDQQIAAFDAVDDLAVRFHLAMDFQPGDIQLLNNYAVMHSRTGFVDHDDPAKKRHLLRLWLTLHDERPLPEGFGRNPGFRDANGGRGGMRTPRLAYTP